MHPCVLIVDDDPEWLEVVSQFLTAQQLDVMTATNGQGALDLLKIHSKIRAVVLDLNMPVMSGLQFYRRFRRSPRFREVHLFVLTGDRDSDRRVRPMAVAAYLRKPIDLNELAERLKAVCPA